MKISIKELKRIIKEEIENIAEFEDLGQAAAEQGAEQALAPEEKLQSDVEKIKVLIPRVDNKLEMTDLLSITLKHALTGKVGLVALRQVLGSSIASAIAKKLGAGV